MRKYLNKKYGLVPGAMVDITLLFEELQLNYEESLKLWSSQKVKEAMTLKFRDFCRIIECELNYKVGVIE
ncbi:hypothetical protein ACLHDG_09020 [Sulfurovum sp. CS9]|uniref:hypothetical protein n=1 Tax=Sulfurovum sp. CS9 TaxID=3391146 RepID=UPI0039EAF2CF